LELAADNVTYTQDNVTADILFDRYEFVDGETTLATLYVQNGIGIDGDRACGGAGRQPPT
jgi:hypothetical protein